MQKNAALPRKIKIKRGIEVGHILILEPNIQKQWKLFN